MRLSSHKHASDVVFIVPLWTNGAEESSREPDCSVDTVVPTRCMLLPAYSHTATFPAFWENSQSSVVLCSRPIAAFCCWVGGMAVPPALLLLLPAKAGPHTQALSTTPEQYSSTLSTLPVNRAAGYGAHHRAHLPQVPSRTSCAILFHMLPMFSSTSGSTSRSIT